jgi:hypothetical protein
MFTLCAPFITAVIPCAPMKKSFIWITSTRPLGHLKMKPIRSSPFSPPFQIINHAALACNPEFENAATIPVTFLLISSSSSQKVLHPTQKEFREKGPPSELYGYASAIDFGVWGRYPGISPKVSLIASRWHARYGQLVVMRGRDSRKTENQATSGASPSPARRVEPAAGGVGRVRVGERTLVI